MLAPVALYPDSLLSQITTASTNPQEILDADNWLHQHRGFTGTALTDAAEKQGFDPAFIALVNFPSVLAMMAQDVDDYAAIGDAFSPIREPYRLRFNVCARRLTKLEPCAAIPSRKCNYSQRADKRFMSFSQPIRKLCMCRNTTRQWCMSEAQRRRRR